MDARRQGGGGYRRARGAPLVTRGELRVDKARGLEVEDFGGGVVGFRLPEEGAEAPAKVATGGGRRKAAAG